MANMQKPSDRRNQTSEMDAYMQNLSEERTCTNNNSLLFTAATPLLNQKPVKKPRQWAAWTRQEEENFFNALRQVGKNFEKITRRVQSKNKDQVRHYYYRLVRRMNKLLGPGYCLDAKNSKDTIAAMLRWWALLEKFSCTASKLRLKPRRFKTFVEAFENQLIKDRNKSRRKRPQGDMDTAPASPNSGKGLGTGNNDPCPGVDNPNGIKLPPKGSYKRANVDGTGNTKGDLTATKTVKQKRRGGMVGSAAYKKWEKAAMAGVSLVADAAEQLERANLNKDRSIAHHNMMCSHNGAFCNYAIDGGAQSLMKLKLQLFPINEATRKALEKDSHNPHLELTLSGRKRIASVLEHLNRKWGNSDVACGELVLLPYSASIGDLNSQRWTLKDTVVAADVFVSVGSPSVFRLRYGWFTNSEIASSNSVIAQGIQTGNHFLSPSSNRCLQQSMARCLIGPNAVEEVCGNQENNVVCPGDLSTREWADSLTNISVGYLFSEASRAAHLDCAESSVNKNAQIEEAAQSIDSFDATIAAHLSSANNGSLFGADETRDGFSFFCNVKINEEACTNSLGYQGLRKGSSGNMAANDIDCAIKEANDDHEPEAKDSSSDDNNENTPNDTSFTDIYWPDSLGPLDLDVPSFRYQGPELGFSDSLNSLTRMMASSCDGFRNSSFLGNSDN
ncbi:TSL-kinase interacting protein 1 [Rhynchospora pubera]|uniref:TSL-kinase interacting protein 1 n=1 Tax=Rhynchospora pubera TaxID=906938 RepID=A0AAV8EE66_9POAL|nr:TSL-kinase interacting protein 1 [Rhynchospora pubera]KAJ4778994.1 TSL-kinase interacting protein 1 [Rhynchospora pubera]